MGTARASQDISKLAAGKGREILTRRTAFDVSERSVVEVFLADQIMGNRKKVMTIFVTDSHLRMNPPLPTSGLFIQQRFFRKWAR
jgi:hypothetical protein